MQRIFKLDEKEQLRHLQQALKNATERGLATFDTLEERDHYKDILHTLSQPGPQGEALRQETLQIFTLTEAPNLATLNDLYNQRRRFYDGNHQDEEIAKCVVLCANCLETCGYVEKKPFQEFS